MGIGEEKNKEKSMEFPYMKTMEAIERETDSSLRRGEEKH